MLSSKGLSSMWSDIRHRSSLTLSKVVMGGLVVCMVLMATGCHQSMYDQDKFKKPNMQTEATHLFENGQISRPRVPGTVSQSQVLADEHFYTGQIDGEYVTEFPYPITIQILRRGQDRFDIFCAPCHGRVGNGMGMVQRHGLTPPANYHDKRLREASVGYIFDVITNGFRNMYPYGPKLPPEDRWAIIAYVRALQLSQNATCDDVPDGKSFKEECE